MYISETEILSENGVKYSLAEYLNPVRFFGDARNIAHKFVDTELQLVSTVTDQ